MLQLPLKGKISSISFNIELWTSKLIHSPCIGAYSWNKGYFPPKICPANLTNLGLSKIGIQAEPNFDQTKLKPRLDRVEFELPSSQLDSIMVLLGG